MNRTTPGFPGHHQLRDTPKPMSTELVMPSNHLILYRPLILMPYFPSIRVFSNESALHIRWPKYWSFSFNISPNSEHPELISFRMDWLDLLAVQGTLKSLLQHHNSKASILRHLAFFTVQISHPYITTGKKDFKCLFCLITHCVEDQEITDIVLLISPSLYEPMYLSDKYWLTSHCVT